MLKRYLFNRHTITVLAALIVAWITAIIFLNHNNIAFWLQSDNVWAPTFVYDLVVKHHSVFNWQLANGTIHLTDTISFFLFSFFTHDIQQWITWNAILNIILYYICFYCLASVLSKSPLVTTIIMLSCIISLTLVACFKIIPFTLDMLLISGQHIPQLLLSILCLSIVIKLICQGSHRGLLILLSAIVTIECCSDELILVSFIAPMLASLICLLLVSTDKATTCKKLIIWITISAFLGKLFWLHLPLHYKLTSAMMNISIIESIQAIILFYRTIIHQHPIFITLQLVYLPLSLIVAGHAFKRGFFNSNAQGRQKALAVALLFTIFVWGFGFISIFVNYHLASFLLLHTVDLAMHYRFHQVALMRDSMAFFIMPVFIGFPLLLIYSIYTIKQTWYKKSFVFIGSLISLSLLVILYKTYHSATQITPYKKIVANESVMTDCLEANIKRYHLHTGIADYWIYRPIEILSHYNIKMSSIYAGVRSDYEHYLTTWNDINHQQIDYWIASYPRFYNDPTYTGYYNTKQDIAYKMKKFGHPDGSFVCISPNGGNLTAYIYKHNQINKAMLPSIKIQGMPNTYINKSQQIVLKR